VCECSQGRGEVVEGRRVGGRGSVFGFEFD
jgi:hypothetical protein